MKYILLPLSFIVFLTGCTSLTPDPETNGYSLTSDFNRRYIDNYYAGKYYVSEYYIGDYNGGYCSDGYCYKKR